MTLKMRGKSGAENHGCRREELAGGANMVEERDGLEDRRRVNRDGHTRRVTRGARESWDWESAAFYDGHRLPERGDLTEGQAAAVNLVSLQAWSMGGWASGEAHRFLGRNEMERGEMWKNEEKSVEEECEIVRGRGVAGRVSDGQIGERPTSRFTHVALHTHTTHLVHFQTLGIPCTSWPLGQSRPAGQPRSQELV
jgi:hypothetical protein